MIPPSVIPVTLWMLCTPKLTMADPSKMTSTLLANSRGLKPAMRTLGLSPSVAASSLLIVVTFWCCVFSRGMDITSPK